VKKDSLSSKGIKKENKQKRLSRKSKIILITEILYIFKKQRIPFLFIL